MPEPPACHACGGRTDELIDLGPQPVLNRFPATTGEPELAHPFLLRLCVECALVQLSDPLPPDELRPRASWIAYNEPEAHLDTVAERVGELTGRDARVLGVSTYDRPLLDRLGGTVIELGVDAPNAGTETLQAALVPAAVPAGQADVVVARYVVEHAHDLGALLSALRRLTRPGGHVVVEVPNCVPPLERADYSTLWEEHVLYFTPATLRSALRVAGLAPVAEISPVDVNAIVSIAEVSSASTPTPPDAAERERAERFAGRLPEVAARWRELLARSGRAALLGAGHTGMFWVNALGLGDAFVCVIDDHPRKQGLRTPGARLPIVPSPALRDDDIDTCVLAVAPAAEERVVAAQEGWAGRFLSMTPGSPRHPFDGAPVAA